VLGETAAQRIMADRLWPAIVARMDLAVRQGGNPDQLARDAAGMLAGHLADLAPAQLATATLWQLSLLADPEPLSDLEAEHAAAVVDDELAEQVLPEDAHLVLAQFASADLGLLGELLPDTGVDPVDPGADEPVDQVEPVNPRLQAAREALTAAAGYYSVQVHGSWVPEHLHARGLDGLQAGYAPAGWTTLVDGYADAGTPTPR
jgi:hypothetical protein